MTEERAKRIIRALRETNTALHNDLRKFATMFPVCEICVKGKFDIECTTWTDEKGREVCDFIWRGPCEENDCESRED